MHASVIALFALVAVASAQQFVQPDPRNGPAIGYTSTQDEAGQFSHAFSTGHGAALSQRLYLKPGGPEGPIPVQEGTIVVPDGAGSHHTLTYVADELGYRPQGRHLPTV